MGSSQQFSLRWNNYLSHITGAFESLRSEEDLVDVTLSCEGKRIRAHKMLLSACSTYFRDLFKENPCQHPVIIFRNVKYEDLVALIDFMYQGEVNVVQEQLASFLTTAELLAVQGLSEGSGKDSNSECREDEGPDSPALPPEPEVQMTSSLQSSNQTVSGSSVCVSSPTSFYSVDKEPESPPMKRQKWSSNSAGSKRNSANGGIVKDSGKESESEKKQGSCKLSAGSDIEPIEIDPIVPNLKVEMPEYMEKDQETSSCSYSDSNAGIASSAQNSNRDSVPSLSHSLASGPLLEGKHELPDVFNTSSRDSSLPPESFPPSDFGQILSKPGPSVENQSQDSLQGFLRHHLTKMGVHGKVCWQCKHKQRTTQKGAFRQTRFMCLECNICLCKELCFEEYHVESGIPINQSQSNHNEMTQDDKHYFVKFFQK